MYDPVYLVESLNIPIALVQADDMDRYRAWCGHVLPLLTIWYVDETGVAVKVQDEVGDDASL